MRALHSAGVTVLGGPRAVDLGVVGGDKISPGFKTEYGACVFVALFSWHSGKATKGWPSFVFAWLFCCFGLVCDHAVYYCDFFCFEG